MANGELIRDNLKERFNKSPLLYIIVSILMSSGVGFGSGFLGGNQALESRVMKLEIHLEYAREEIRELKQEINKLIDEVKKK